MIIEAIKRDDVGKFDLLSGDLSKTSQEQNAIDDWLT